MQQVISESGGPQKTRPSYHIFFHPAYPRGRKSRIRPRLEGAIKILSDGDGPACRKRARASSSVTDPRYDRKSKKSPPVHRSITCRQVMAIIQAQACSSLALHQHQVLFKPFTCLITLKLKTNSIARRAESSIQKRVIKAEISKR
jgi:hypothetical protein